MSALKRNIGRRKVTRVDTKRTIFEALGRHPIHPFPARMAPGIVLDILGSSGRNLRVLDPMMGSGTVLAVARSRGHRAIGIDIDPLAVLLAGVWTSRIDRDRYLRFAESVLKRAKVKFKNLALSKAYPRASDESTRKFIRYWFDAYSRRQLTALSDAIARVRDEKMRSALWCAFSRLIITKQAGASLAMDLSHSRPHRVFEKAPVKPFNRFLSAVNHVAQNCVQAEVKDGYLGPATQAKEGDARKTRVSTGSIDIVVTSPPYLNAIDYMRCSKFSLVWMGYSIEALGQIRSRSIGSEVGQKDTDQNRYVRRLTKKLGLSKRLSGRHSAVLTRFIEDMYGAICETSRVLVPGGKAVYVVGENTIRGAYIENAKIIIELARRAGLRLQRRSSRRLPSNRRYLPPPGSRDAFAQMNSRMRREVVLIFGKPKARGSRRR
jgi:DNA modification methylase